MAAKQIQTLLGHVSITMTMGVYRRLFDNARAGVTVFEKLARDLSAARWPCAGCVIGRLRLNERRDGVA
jgi:integrase